MRRVFVGLAQVFVGLAAQLRNNRVLRKVPASLSHNFRHFSLNNIHFHPATGAPTHWCLTCYNAERAVASEERAVTHTPQERPLAASPSQGRIPIPLPLPYCPAVAQIQHSPTVALDPLLSGQTNIRIG